MSSKPSINGMEGVCVWGGGGGGGNADSLALATSLV